MKTFKNFITRQKDFLLSLCLIICACAVMSAIILPYKTLMSAKPAHTAEERPCASLSVLYPVGIAYDLDCNMLAKFIFSVAENEPYVCQVSVGATIVNRKNNAHFSSDIVSVIFNCSPHFNEDILSLEPSGRAKHAARDALMGVDPSGGALYFFTDKNETDAESTKKIFTAKYGSIRFAK